MFIANSFVKQKIEIYLVYTIDSDLQSQIIFNFLDYILYVI